MCEPLAQIILSSFFRLPVGALYAAAVPAPRDVAAIGYSFPRPPLPARICLRCGSGELYQPRSTRVDARRRKRRNRGSVFCRACVAAAIVTALHRMIGAHHISITEFRGRPISHSHVKNCERRKGSTGELIYRSARTPRPADAGLSDSIADGRGASNPLQTRGPAAMLAAFQYLRTFDRSGHDDD